MMRKSYLKLFVNVFTVLMVSFAVVPSVTEASFEDVSSRYTESIDFLLTKGAKGISESYFGINEEIKRVDAAVLTANVLGLDTHSAPDSGFKDVPARAKGAVNALKAAGITSGKTTTAFDSDSSITRGEVAMWLQKGFKLKGATSMTFKDVSGIYEVAVQALVANGITSGMSPEKYGIEVNVKRGDFAIFLHNSSRASNTLIEDNYTPTEISIQPAQFSGTPESPKVFYTDVRVDVTGISKLENAIVKGNLTLKGNNEILLSNVTVEGDTILVD